jgi:hypothetical protein
LNTLIDATTDLIRYAKIDFNTKKCKLIIHNPQKEPIANIFLLNDKNERKKLEVCKIDTVIKYLGIRLGDRKQARMRFN